jgi:hypothetical protein
MHGCGCEWGTWLGCEGAGSEGRRWLRRGGDVRAALRWVWKVGWWASGAEGRA